MQLRFSRYAFNVTICDQSHVVFKTETLYISTVLNLLLEETAQIRMLKIH